MKRSAVNSSLSPSVYYWSDCDPYNDDGSGELRGPSTGFLILCITYCFEFLAGAPSNLWLTCHILRQRSKVAGVLPGDFFPLHLALTQLSFFLGLLTFFANHFLWQSNNVLALVTFLNAMVFVMKPLLLCLVCVDRYMAVVRPLDYQRFKSRRYRWGCLGVSWFIYFIMASYSLVQRSAFTLVMLFLPVMVVDTFCSLSVLKTLKKPPLGDRVVMEKKETRAEDKKAGKKGSRVVKMEEGKQEQGRMKEGKREEKVKKVGRSEPRGERVMNSMKKKAFITIAIIQAVLTLNQLPILLALPLERLVPARTLKCQYLPLGLAATVSCSYLQPLLYLHRLGRLPCMMPRNT